MPHPTKPLDIHPHPTPSSPINQSAHNLQPANSYKCKQFTPKTATVVPPEHGGRKKRGRPKNSGRRLVTKEAGRSWNELRFLAADRNGKKS
jgi:hypothetical protein